MRGSLFLPPCGVVTTNLAMDMAEITAKQQLSQWIEDLIKRFCLDSPENSLKNPTGDRAWDEPLVGFSRGNDPVYLKLKEDIGPFYMTPDEVFNRFFPSTPALPHELSVVSWILPQTKATRSDHRKESLHPSERWARSRHFGEAFNVLLRDHVCNSLKEACIQAVAPVNAPFWTRQASENYGLASNWSERHAAFVSGLGTFGLCDGIITPVGKAVRCGSVVARMAVEPTERPYKGHHDYCLHFSQGECDQCIKRCPAGAISQSGHDKTKCQSYLKEMSKLVKERLGFETSPCGLCQTKVPCEFRIPVAAGGKH